MKSEQEVRDLIKKTTDQYGDVLCSGLASIDINAPRALMQLEGVTKLNALYYILGETRPRFTYDDPDLINH